MEDFYFDYDGYEWEEEPQKKPIVETTNAEIYKLSIKEMNQLIYNKLEEIISLLSTLKK